MAGHVLRNDVSERAYQLARGSEADKGKGCNSFTPVGPYLVPPDALPDVPDLLL